MSFAEGFYNLHIEVSAYERDLQAKFKLKTVRHPEESLSDVAARIIIFSLNYSPELKLSSGAFEPDLPIAYTKDFSDQFTSAYFWLMPSLRLIKRFWLHKLTQLEVYCSAEENFHDIFKLSIPEITKIAQGARYWFLPNDFLTSVAERLNPSSSLKLNLIEGIIYCTVDQHDLTGSLQQLDLLQEYQMTLNGERASIPATV